MRDMTVHKVLQVLTLCLMSGLHSTENTRMYCAAQLVDQIGPKD